MRKGLKVTLVVLGLLVLLALTFFLIDYSRVKKQEKPIFCINTTTYKDGGTKVYYGLGYKVIAFNKMLKADEKTMTIPYYKSIKIGSWFMKCDDFYNEIKDYEKELSKQSKEEITIRAVYRIDMQEKKVITLNQEETKKVSEILNKLSFNKETCDGLFNYFINYNNENTSVSYGLETYESAYHITLGGQGEAILSANERDYIEQVIKKYFN